MRSESGTVPCGELVEPVDRPQRADAVLLPRTQRFCRVGPRLFRAARQRHDDLARLGQRSDDPEPVDTRRQQGVIDSAPIR